ncbi:hypothetical protein PSTT_10960, partial [Puccinia striiformis]
FSTQSSLQAGYTSDGTDFQAHHSSRISTPIKRAGMIQPLPDSRQLMVQELPLVQSDLGSNAHPRKQKEILIDSESKAPLTSSSTEEKKRSKRKQNNSQSIPTSSNAPTSEPVAQDPDEENSKRFESQEAACLIYVLTVTVLVKLKGTLMDVQSAKRLSLLEQSFPCQVKEYTMAEVMQVKLRDLNGSTKLDWNYATMHIGCFCHKMVLVVNTGLNELVVEAPPPLKLSREFLGAFPYSGTMKKMPNVAPAYLQTC